MRWERGPAELTSHDGSRHGSFRVLLEPPMDLFPGATGLRPPLDVLLEEAAATLDVDLVLLGHVNERIYTTVAFFQRKPLGFEKGTRLPIGETYCREEIIAAEPFVLGDAEIDPRFRMHPGYRKHGLRAYVGAPIFLCDGTLFGTLCGVDARARTFTLRSVEDLIGLAQRVSDDLSARLGVPDPRPGLSA